MLIEHLIIIDRTALLDTIMVLLMNVIWTDLLVHLLTHNRLLTDIVTFDDNGNRRKVHYDLPNTHDANINLDHHEMGTNWHGQLGAGINYPDKNRGYIALQPTDFQFIGPDRPGIDTSDLDFYLKVARTIRQSGVANYRQIRIPVISGLNIQAWQHHLRDYCDQKLVQYLQYGFPLSIRNPDILVSQDIRNNFSALQHQEAVASYLAKEKSLGAITGPILNWGRILMASLYTAPPCSQDQNK